MGMNIVGLAFMSCTQSNFNFTNGRLWGFWVCIIWSSLMIIYDCIILLKIRKERKIISD